MYRSNNLRQSAKCQGCTLNVATVCNYNNETTVLAHLQFEGGIMASKTDDFSACFSCSNCHAWLDGHSNEAPEEKAYQDFYKGRALYRTIRYWIDNGFLNE